MCDAYRISGHLDVCQLTRSQLIAVQAIGQRLTKGDTIVSFSNTNSQRLRAGHQSW